jgi:hypothetical protein
MTQRTHSTSPARAGTSWESWLVLASVAILAGLAVADRLVAWLIGEFPSSAALWQLRFEYLRPIGVFYDIASVRLGGMSGVEFSAFLLIASAALVAGAMSPIRLVRASSLHILLVSCLALCTYSLDVIDLSGGIGSPSSSYAFLGATIALPILGICLRIHVEYMGLSPVSSRSVRRFLVVARRTRDKLPEMLVGLLEPFVPATSRLQVVLARRSFVRDRRSRR